MAISLDWETQVTLTVGIIFVVSASMLVIPWLAMWPDTYRGRHEGTNVLQRVLQLASRDNHYNGRHRKGQAS